ncbi:MAG TPA: hypothetical protein PLS81_03120 [Deltaproteobacteria bacterium]|nr:hypothetical protein [Deltaproteobacteria bacterium]HOM28430.1 hypothetical protein [Deltaproteobacteria bacterium]HPP81404.1 hypothetical protein [Deltaproteobacteria bacterium]
MHPPAAGEHATNPAFQSLFFTFTESTSSGRRYTAEHSTKYWREPCENAGERVDVNRGLPGQAGW